MNGAGAEAIDFYTRHLNAKVILKVTYEDMKKMDPSMVVERCKEQWISHSILEIGVQNNARGRSYNKAPFLMEPS